MNKEVTMIVSNFNRYFSSFAESGIVDLHEEGVHYILPKPGHQGPTLLFHVGLDPQTADARIKALLPEIDAGHVPGNWFITPGATPDNVTELLKANGFENMGGGEPAMLLRAERFRPTPSNSRVTCREITSMEDFRIWIDIVNEALHGWNMIDAQHYYAWVKKRTYRFWLGEINGLPVSTAATIQTENAGSLEFVSTLESFRRQGAAAITSTAAIAGLLEAGAQYVSLSACGESVPLYQKLGFESIFEPVMFRRQKAT